MVKGYGPATFTGVGRKGIIGVPNYDGSMSYVERPHSLCGWDASIHMPERHVLEGVHDTAAVGVNVIYYYYCGEPIPWHRRRDQALDMDE